MALKKQAPPKTKAAAPKGKSEAPTKAVALKKNTGLTLPSGVDIGNDIGAGKGNADKDSFAIPFLTVVQKMSPYVDEDDPKYIPEAKAGMFINTVTLELFDGKEGIVILPCEFQRRFIRWGPRDGGGGFKGEMLPEAAAQLRADGKVKEIEGRLYFPDEKGKVDEKKSDYLSDTRNHFCILVDDDGNMHQMLLSLASTQIKKSKQLMTLLDAVKVLGKSGNVTPPTWANKVRLTTVGESNDKGSWSGVVVNMEGLVDSQELYAAGKAFHDLVTSGKAKVNYDQAAPEGEDRGQF